MGANWQALTGQSMDMLETVYEGRSLMLHSEVMPYWRELEECAATAGFSLQIASAWRGFDRQRLIWNGKATGERQVLDDCGIPLDINLLSHDQLLFAMLRWSAIPGCSRHHWGTDLDVFDSAAMPAGYELQLVTSECEGNGVFAGLHGWLDRVLSHEGSVFCRPYSQDCGGIAPERWHISCRPVARCFDELLDEGRLIDWIMTQDIALKDRIYLHWHDIFHRYVRVSYDGAE
jgi:LAS superfamily LD-carboxypeptidase LdcB